MYDVKVDGASSLVNRISRFDKDVYKTLRREVKSATDVVRADAQSLLPGGRALSGTMLGEQVSRGWGPWSSGGRDLGFDGGAMRVQAQARKTSRRVGGERVYGMVGRVVAPTSPAAAIFMLAGSRTPRRLPGWGGNFNAELNARYGTVFPRALTTAWRRGAPRAAARIDAAIDAAAAAINK